MPSYEPTVLLLGPSGDGRAEVAAALGSPVVEGSAVFRASADGLGVKLVVGPPSSDLLSADLARRGLLEAVDALVVFVPATGRVDGESAAIVNAAALPLVLVLTHLEHERADPNAAVEASSALLDRELVLTQLPVFGADEQVAAVLDLLSLEVLEPGQPARPADPEHVQAVQDEHEALVEEVLAAAEDGLEDYLRGLTPAAAELALALGRAVGELALAPVLCLGSAGPALPGGPALLRLLGGIDAAAPPRIVDSDGDFPADGHGFGFVLDAAGVVRGRWGQLGDEPLLAGGQPCQPTWTPDGDLVVTGPGVAIGAVVCSAADPLWLAD